MVSSKADGRGRLRFPWPSDWPPLCRSGTRKPDSRSARWIKLRHRLESGLIAALGPERVIRNGPAKDELRLPQTLNLGFPGIDGDALLMQLDLAGIAASLGSACASGSTRPSPTLMAMRVPDDRLRSSVRFSMGAATTEDEIEQSVVRIIRVCAVASWLTVLKGVKYEWHLGVSRGLLF